MDVLLTRLGNLVEEQLSSPMLEGPNFESMEDLVAACRQVASLQPDGTRQPALRCEGVAALLQGMLDQGQAAAAAAGGGELQPVGGSSSGGSGSGSGALLPEVEAYAQRVLHLVRCKLGELRTAVPGRMSDTGSGTADALIQKGWGRGSTTGMWSCLLLAKYQMGASIGWGQLC